MKCQFAIGAVPGTGLEGDEQNHPWNEIVKENAVSRSVRPLAVK